MKKTHIIESSRFVIILLFFFVFIHLTSCDDSIYISPSDKILLDCGSSGSLTFNGLSWIGDIVTDFFQASYDTTSSTTLLLSNTNKVSPKIPYSTARIFHHSPFTYSFPFSSPGLKFIRLYFLSTSYLPTYPSNSNRFFSVKSGPYTFHNNFNPLLAAQEISSPYITTDFFVNIKQKKLNNTFAPSPLIHKAYAFVNGIETFLVPNNLFSHAYAFVSYTCWCFDSRAAFVIAKALDERDALKKQLEDSKIEHGKALEASEAENVKAYEDLTKAFQREGKLRGDTSGEGL